jgi:hypothetical protein
MRWWGRARLAQTRLRWARQAIAKGNRGKALWHLDAALSLQPRMEEALRLKERLTSKAIWSDHGRESAAKYIIQRLIMHELGQPVERIIPPGKPRDASLLDEKVRQKLGIEPRKEAPLPGKQSQDSASAGDDKGAPEATAEAATPGAPLDGAG